MFPRILLTALLALGFSAAYAQQPTPKSVTSPQSTYAMNLERGRTLLRQGDFDELQQAWNRFAAMEGREVRFLRGGEEVRGTVVEASIRDGLLVRVAGGEPKRFRLEHLSDFAFV